MNIVVPIKSLSKALAAVVPVVPSNPSQRSLSCVYIDAQDAIVLRACDLVTFVRANVDGEVMKPGSCLVAAKALSEIVRVLPGASPNVTLECDGQRLRILCGNAKHTITTLPTEEYPVWPRAFELEATFSAPDLRHAIQTVEHAAREDEARPHLAGVQAVSVDGKLTLTTTDGHRLATTKIPCSAAFEMLLPLKAIGSVLRVLESSGTEEIRFGGDGAQYAGIRSSAHDLVMRTLDREAFPPWSRVVPAQSANRATLCRDILVSALRNVEVAARARSKDLGVVSMIEVRLRTGNVVLSGSNTDGASATDEIDCDYAGEEMVFGVNALYVIQTLNAMSSDDVVFDLADPLAPLRMEPTSDAPSLFIIMPARV